MSAPIQSTDGTMDKFSKLLPADVAAAFMSTKAALITANSGTNANISIVITFALILAVCPVYFSHVGKITNTKQKAFLWVSSLVFAISLANKELTGVLIDIVKNDQWLKISATSIEPTVTAIAIVLPILWTLIVSQIAATLFTDAATPAPAASGQKG